MILEIAQFDIRPEAVRDFEAAYARASHVIGQASGHLGHEMHRSVDTAGRYVLLVRWRTREDLRKQDGTLKWVTMRESPRARRTARTDPIPRGRRAGGSLAR